MDGYVSVIKFAVLAFPLLAIFISSPFILWQYHKYGSISPLKSLLAYSFAFYLLCAYCLVILPLPKIEEVASLTTPRTQLLPFKFVPDFIRETSLNPFSPATYLVSLTESCFLVPLYNIVLTVPFGIYLRYYFRCSFKKVIILSFLLSLFFELTQLSGLYGLYPRGYRLFDVDDLLLNTFGGLVGFLLAGPVIHILPSRDVLDARSRARSQRLSGLRRTTAFLFDLFLFSLLSSFIGIITQSCLHCSLDSFWIFLASTIVYFVVFPAFLGCCTPAERFLNLQIVDLDQKPSLRSFYFRLLSFLFIYILIPFLCIRGIDLLPVDFDRTAARLTFLFGLSTFYLVTAGKYLLTSKPLLFEKLSRTKMISSLRPSSQSDHQDPNSPNSTKTSS